MMTYDDAVSSAELISARYPGETAVFKEPGRKISYQAISPPSAMPPGAALFAKFVCGKSVSAG